MKDLDDCCARIHRPIRAPVRGDWGSQPYPLTVGHEIAGVVAEVGSAVTRYQLGVCCMVNSCGKSVNCQAGDEQSYAEGVVATYGAVEGASQHVGQQAGRILKS
ncbi:alcohol dehydrogenase catalytic domain-containing protein [Amycolatopsis thermoflava]|uniref:alcohol dehydrogenase catalytic domain-containing protein n=1 Tax=Amycolatopsis thermoflava TaxID=84480 RepID=UPI0022B251D5|nr:alcohol dehydrogenase catalytic domain-containing protein [Amycolatopsis thermoflava]